MKGVFRLLAVMSAGALFVGCGDDESGPKTKTVEDTQTLESSKTLGNQSGHLATITVGTDAMAAKGPITTVGGAMQQLVGLHQNAKVQARQGAAVGGLTQAQMEEGGTVTFEDGHLSADVSYASSTGGTSVSVHYLVDLHITENDLGGHDIDGSFDLEFSVSQANYEVSIDYDGEYEALKLDGDGCAVAGKVAVAYDYKLGGELFDQLPADQRAAIKKSAGGGSGYIAISFGPNCGDVSAEGY